MRLTKNKIRKIILQEMRKKIIREQEESEQRTGPQLTREQAIELKALTMKNSKLFARGITEPGMGTQYTESDAAAIAKKIYDATKAGWLDGDGALFGMGTSHEELVEALKEVPSLADLSFVSWAYKQKYSGRDLAKDISTEYSSFTGDDFYEVEAAIRGIRDKALFFVDGKPITVPDMREFANATRQQADVLANVTPVEGDVNASDVLVGAAGAATVGAASATAAAAGIGAIAGIMTVSSAAVGTAGAAALGAGAGLATLYSIGGMLGPWGWAGLAALSLGIGAYMAFDSEEFSEDELKMLSSEFYEGLASMFDEMSAALADKANKIVIPDETPDAGDQDTNTGMVEYPELGFGHTSPYIPKIIKTLNAYAETRNLEGYTPCSGTRWSGKVQECWLAVVPHALANCDKFENHSDIEDVSDWNAMSNQMRSEFPGYVRGPRGCCAFIMDAYYCEIRFGNEAPTSGGGGDGGGSGDGDSDSGDNTGDQDTDAGSTGTRGGITNRIRVRLNKTIPGGGNTFESHGFTLNGSPNVSEVFANSLIQNFKNKRVAKGVKPAILNFLMELDADNNIISVRRQRGDGSASNFVARLRDIDGDLLDVARDLELPSEGSGSPYAVGSDKFDTKGGRGRGGSGKYIKFSMNIRGGSYDGYL